MSKENIYEAMFIEYKQSAERIGAKIVALRKKTNYQATKYNMHNSDDLLQLGKYEEIYDDLIRAINELRKKIGCNNEQIRVS